MFDDAGPLIADLPSITVRAPAKINVSLGVGPRRQDGFHDVQTVYQAVDLCDTVTVAAADRLSVQLHGPESDGLPEDASNLAWRAAALLAQHVGRSPDVSIVLEKSIPVAAGLAGGSADAAGTLVGLNQLWRLNLPDAELAALATQLGSDVSFALVGGTAVGTGRGELLRQLAPVSLHWVLAVAAGGLSTAAVYAELDAQRDAGTAAAPLANTESVLSALSEGDPSKLAAELANDLQPAALVLADYLPALLSTGLKLGALATMVSGSGPTVLLLSKSAAHAQGLSDAINESGLCRYALPVTGGRAGITIEPTIPVGTAR